MSAIYTIKASPGKGNGIFAKRAIKAGTIIFVEKVLLQLPDTCITDEAVVETAFSKLSFEDQNRFLELHEGHRPYKSRVFRIFKANAFGDKDGSRVYDRISRLNHSCVPNAVMVPNSTEPTVASIIASVPISKGKEITISYSSLYNFATKAQRAGPMWMYYGFRCRCPACSLGPKEQWISDTRRRLINVLYHFLQGKSPPDWRMMEALATTMTPQQAERPEFLAMVDHHGAPLKTPPTRSQILAYNVLYAKLMEAEGLLGMDIAEAYAAAIIGLRQAMQAHPDVVLLPSVKAILAWYKQARAIAEQSRGLGSWEVEKFKHLGKQMRDDGLTGPAIYFLEHPQEFHDAGMKEYYDQAFAMSQQMIQVGGKTGLKMYICSEAELKSVIQKGIQPGDREDLKAFVAYAESMAPGAL